MNFDVYSRFAEIYGENCKLKALLRRAANELDRVQKYLAAEGYTCDDPELREEIRKTLEEEPKPKP